MTMPPQNMANAEEDLYKVWKDLTLTSSSIGDQSKYRVWDYPIKEQYTSIYKVSRTVHSPTLHWQFPRSSNPPRWSTAPRRASRK
jgi:hypothetical protein